MKPLDEEAFSERKSVNEYGLQQVRETVPWIRFVAITAFLTCLLFVAGVIFVIAMMPVEVSPVAIVFYGLQLGVIFLVSFTLWQYARHLDHFTQKNRAHDLELAFAKQKIFWMISGILLIMFVVIMIVGLLAGGAAFMSLYPELNKL